MKNSKGFTLIELLAVIVILAIIALIATPIILNVIETARKGAKESSALGYVDAVEKQVMLAQVDSSATKIPSGIYSVEQLTDLKVDIKGEKPENTGIVKINNKGAVSEAWFTYDNGKYKVYYDGSKAVANTEKYVDSEGVEHKDIPEAGSIDTNKAYTIVSGNLDTIGSVVKISDEEFYVIGQEDSTHVKLLTKYNLGAGVGFDTPTNRQDESAKGANATGTAPFPGSIAFANTLYWTSGGYIYNSNSKIYPHVENYVTYLNTQGVNVTGRLINSAELETLGCDASRVNPCLSAPEWVYATSYWTGTASMGYPYVVNYNGTYTYDTFYNEDKYRGIRPVIIMEK